MEHLNDVPMSPYRTITLPKIVAVNLLALYRQPQNKPQQKMLLSDVSALTCLLVDITFNTGVQKVHSDSFEGNK